MNVENDEKDLNKNKNEGYLIRVATFV